MCEKGKCSGHHHHAPSEQIIHEAHHHSKDSFSEISSLEARSNSDSAPKPQKSSLSKPFSLAIKSSCYAVLALLAGLYLWIALKQNPEQHFAVTALVNKDVTQLFLQLSNPQNPSQESFLYQMALLPTSSANENVNIFVLDKKGLILRKEIECAFFTDSACSAKGALELKKSHSCAEEGQIYYQEGCEDSSHGNCHGHAHSHAHSHEKCHGNCHGHHSHKDSDSHEEDSHAHCDSHGNCHGHHSH